MTKDLFFEETKLDPIDRRIIIIGYQFSWDKAWKEEKSFTEWLDGMGKSAPSLVFRFLGHPIYDITLANKYFKFPPNHPQKDTAYAMCDLIPDQYVPINMFHDYFQHMKHSDFVQLCASLGAKKVYLESGKINKKGFSFDVDTEIPTELGNLGIEFATKFKSGKNVYGKLAFSFSEKNKEIKEFYSPWIDTEPTWQAMINMRKNNYVETFKAEYNYVDNFGIDSNISAKIKNAGVNIGGLFTELNKIELKYNVIFW
jgi:hypothetical protein